METLLPRLDAADHGENYVQMKMVRETRTKAQEIKQFIFNYSNEFVYL